MNYYNFAETQIRMVLPKIDIYQHFTFFRNGYLFYLFFFVKNNAVQYCSNVKWRPVWFGLFCFHWFFEWNRAEFRRYSI